jgi:hypothetical protein
MVLKANPNAAGTPAGQFEDMEDGAQAQVATAEKPAAPPAAAPAATTAVAVAPANAVMVKADAVAFQKQVEEIKGAANFDYGNYKVFKGVSGAIATTDGKFKLGRWIQGTMMAWDDHWEVSPGSKTEKSKGAVAYSKNGETIDSIVGNDFAEFVGKPIDDYVVHLQTEGDYPEAKKSRYIDISFFLQAAEDSDSEMIGEVIQITLSQSSIPSFSSYQEGLRMKAKVAARGIAVKLPEDPFTFYFGAESASKDGNNWTKLNVSTKQPTKF